MAVELTPEGFDQLEGFSKSFDPDESVFPSGDDELIKGGIPDFKFTPSPPPPPSNQESPKIRE